MAVYDNLPLAEDENAKPDSNLPGGLPEWAAALPMWASGHWLWLALENFDTLRYWTGCEAQVAATGRSKTLAQLPFTISYSLIVIDDRGLDEIPGDWWLGIERILAPGGLLLVCRSPRPHKRLAGRIRRAAPELCPGEWHVIEPGQGGNWHLRPARVSMRRITYELNPPFGARVWLARLIHRWVRVAGAIDCLPVWSREVCE